MTKKKAALGRGLGALLSDPSTDVTSKGSPSETADKVVGAISHLEIATIEPNPFNPRKDFEEEALAELSESIKIHGVIQPITVRKLGYDRYQIISGERRFRASKKAGLSEIPAYIRISDDQTLIEMALVENIQREDLNAMEVAYTYQQLLEECKISQEKLSERVAKKRSTVTNYLRLLKLPATVQKALRKELISMGHARALLAIDDVEQQEAVLEMILTENLSVRQTEQWIKEYKAGDEPTKEDKKEKEVLSLEQVKIKEDLNKLFGVKVDMQANAKGKGKIAIHFKSDKELQKILDLLDL